MLQKETLEFFRDLRLNNTKVWFDQNRERYESAKADYFRLTEQILTELQKFDPHLNHLRVKDCIFRINRDIRFSNDKTPYKTHVGMIFTQYGRKMEFASYYLHIDEANESFAGGGLYMPPAEALKKTRKELYYFYDELKTILGSGDFKKTYNELDRTKDILLVKTPKGFDNDHESAEYLKLKSFTATKTIPQNWLTDPSGITKAVKILKVVKPLNDFINRALMAGN